MSAALQDPQPQSQGQTDTEAELRILSGRHAGASVPLHARLRLGQGDDCDIILSDLALPQGSAWLQAGDGRWRVTAANPAAPADDAATNDPVMAQDMPPSSNRAVMAPSTAARIRKAIPRRSSPRAYQVKLRHRASCFFSQRRRAAMPWARSNSRSVPVR